MELADEGIFVKTESFEIWPEFCTPSGNWKSITGSVSKKEEAVTFLYSMGVWISFPFEFSLLIAISEISNSLKVLVLVLIKEFFHSSDVSKIPEFVFVPIVCESASVIKRSVLSEGKLTK